MEEAAAAQRSVERTAVPWEVRLGLALRLPPLAWGTCVALVLIGGALVFHAAMRAAELDRGFDGPGLDFATRVALIASATIGYTLAVWRLVGRALVRDLRSANLAPPGLDPDDEWTLHAASPAALRSSRIAGAAGVAFFVLLIEVPTVLFGGRAGDAWTSLHPLTYMLGLGLLFFWLAGRVAFISLVSARGGLGPDAIDVRARPIDLLDLRAFRVFGRIALRGSLTWVVGFSIATLAFLNPELRFSESLVVFVPVFLATLAIAVGTLLLPVRGIHRRIVVAKREELGRVDAAIRGNRSALGASRLADRADGLTLADLVAYRGLIEGLPEWPFDASAVRRLLLYLLIPLLSWTGGALVERVLGLALD